MLTPIAKFLENQFISFPEGLDDTIAIVIRPIYGIHDRV